MALQERRRGCASLYGCAGGERLCAGFGDQHSHRQGFALDDAEIQGRRTGVRSGYGDHYLRGRSVGCEESGLSRAQAPPQPDDLRGYEPRRVPFGRQQFRPGGWQRGHGCPDGHFGRLLYPGVRCRTAVGRRGKSALRARRVGGRPDYRTAGDDLRRQPERYGPEPCGAGRKRPDQGAFQRKTGRSAAGGERIGGVRKPQVRRDRRLCDRRCEPGAPLHGDQCRGRVLAADRSVAGYVVQDLLPAGSPPERSAEGLGAFCELQKSGTQL